MKKENTRAIKCKKIMESVSSIDTVNERSFLNIDKDVVLFVMSVTGQIFKMAEVENIASGNSAYVLLSLDKQKIISSLSFLGVNGYKIKVINFSDKFKFLRWIPKV